MFNPRYNWVGEGNPLGIVQEVLIWLYEQMVNSLLRIRPKKYETQTSLGFWDTNGSPNLGQTTTLIDNQWNKKEKRELVE